MDIKQLQPADVLLFSYIPGDMISELIHQLTGSPVSHAALVYRDPAQLIEQSPPQVTLNPIAERVKGRTVTVMRYQPDTDLTPVLQAADQFLVPPAAYSRPLEIALALLFATQKLQPDPLQQTLLAELLLLAMAEVDKKQPNSQPMVCSTLVTQSFINAGLDLQMDPSALPLAFIDEAIRILQQQPGMVQSVAVPAATLQQVDLSDLSRELVARLPQHTSLTLAQHTLALAKKLCASMNIQSGDGPLDALLALKAHRAWFVSPNDLLCHCQALHQVGVIVTPA